MSRTILALAAAASSMLLAGCISGRCCPSTRRAPEPATAEQAGPTHPVTRTSAFYRGDDGRPTDLAAMLAEWKDADIVAFGELHGDPVGAATELAVLEGMAAQGRPVAVALEFFETDTQAALDEYLAGNLSSQELMERARQNPAYPRTHGPLVDFCKSKGWPVIAANAPRRLVSDYRKSDKDYAGYLESLSEEDRGWLPEETSTLDDDYQKRFVAMMGGERGKTYFRSQSLWDDAMAESMYKFRQEHPEYRILFVVGGFHVQSGFGTITKYRLRRAKDDVRILYMTMDRDPSLPWQADDAGTGDLVLKVPFPAPKPTGPNPHEKKPTTSPHEPKAPKPDANS